MSGRPNILILMADQLRQDALGCYGNPLIRTPCIDAFAASGVRFSHACCPTPICIASRMSFITGMRAAGHHWVANNALPGPVPELPTVASLLRRVGYHTSAIGKMHFNGRMFGLQSHLRMEECVRYRIDDDYLLFLKDHGVRTRYPHGVRDLLYFQPQTCGIPESLTPSRWVADRSVDWLRQHLRHRGNTPFLLWSSWIAPHPPFAPCEPYDRMYRPKDCPLPVYADRPGASLTGAGRASRGRLCGAHGDPDRIQRIRALYAGQVTHVDACMGQVLDELDRLGLTDNTIVLLLSDHGEMLGDHGLSQKSLPYGPSVRVPMILRWPGRTAGVRGVCDARVGIEDFLPTLIDELGMERDGGRTSLPGINLLRAIQDDQVSQRPEYFIDFGSAGQRWVSVRSHQYAYTFWFRGGLEELYDLRADPYETRNVAAQLPELTRDRHRRVEAFERQWGLAGSFEGGRLRTWPITLPNDACSDQSVVMVNEGRWPDNLPVDERDTIETYAEAFNRAIRDEITLTPDKLPLAQYRDKGGYSLDGTAWGSANDTTA